MLRRGPGLQDTAPFRLPQNLLMTFSLSLWWMQPGPGLPADIAILGASSASSAAILGPIDQPTTLRDQTSATAATYSRPRLVRTCATSANHAPLGPLAPKSPPARSGTLGAWAACLPAPLGLRALPLVAPSQPYSDIMRAARFRDVLAPRLRSTWYTLGDPYIPRPAS